MTEINDYLSNEGLPVFGQPIEDRVDGDGVNTRIVPYDRVFFTPTDENIRDLGYTAMGVSATALSSSTPTSPTSRSRTRPASSAW
jgi:hypothetical protein